MGEKFFNRLSSPEVQARIEELDLAYKKEEAYRLSQQKKAAELADIERLGGIRQYEDFTAEKYTAKQILRDMANYPKENYYLWGAAGTGKTHAAVAAARNIKQARLVRMANISRMFRKDISSEQEEKYIRLFASIPLVLDDIGSEKMTDFLQGILFEIIDRRWSNKTGGLIITANMSIANLAKVIGDRTASRIAGLVGAKNVLEISGTDRRLEKDNL